MAFVKPSSLADSGTKIYFRSEHDLALAREFYADNLCRWQTESSDIADYPFALLVFPPPKSAADTLARILPPTEETNHKVDRLALDKINEFLEE